MDTPIYEATLAMVQRLDIAEPGSERQVSFMEKLSEWVKRWW